MNLRLAMTMTAALTGAAVGLPAAASAQTTLGSVVRPPDSVGAQCPAGYVVLPADVPAEVPSYTVPENASELYDWQINAQGSLAGTPVTLVVARPAGEEYTVAALDRQTLPADPGDIVTFQPATPIAVRGGDVIGLHVGPGLDCAFDRGRQQSGTVAIVTGVQSLAVGDTLEPSFISPPGGTVNLAASVRGVQDAAVAPRAEASAYAGAMTAVHATVTNRGPGREPIEYTTVVADGLAIRSVVAGAGRCRVEGQTVRCWISGLLPGESVPVVINVVPAAAGTYPHSASVRPAEGGRDPDPSNNSGTVGLTVRELPKAGGDEPGGGGNAGGGGSSGPAASPAPCVVPVLKGTPLKVAKAVLPELGCTVGKVKRVRSRKVRRGAVIGTSPAASTQPAGARVDLRVSRGRRRASR